MMDAVPVTLGQEFGGYAAQIRLGHDRVGTRSGAPRRSAGRDGDGHRVRNASRVRGEGARAARARRGAAGRVRGAGEPGRVGRAARGIEGCRRVADKIAQDLVLMGSGPRPGSPSFSCRAAEGLVDHAGQGEPGDPGGGAPGGRPGDRERQRGDRRRTQGNFELNVRVPMIARNVFDSITLLTSASSCWRRSASTGSCRTRRTCARHAESTPRSPPRSTPTSATTRGPRSCRRP